MIRLIKQLPLTALWLLGFSFLCLASVSQASPAAPSSITEQEVKNAQAEWGKALVEIGKAYTHKQNYKPLADSLISKLYAYNIEPYKVLFNPTKAVRIPFRPTKEGALSYFVGGNTHFEKDKGFALKPWRKVVFHNNGIYLHNDIALAMGYYVFSPKQGKPVRVEYTFGYIKAPNGQLKIVLHHSSLPYEKR